MVSKEEALGAFAKLRKATSTFMMSLRLPVFPSAWNNSAPTGPNFTKFDIWGFLGYLSRQCSLIKIWQEGRVLDMKTYVPHVWYLAEFFLEWQNFQPEVVEEITTRVLFSKTFLRKSCCLWNTLEKYGRTRQAIDDRMMRRRKDAWMQNADTHSHLKFIAFRQHQFRMSLNVTLHLHYLSFYYL
jgi:hypothetical protein